MDFYHAFCIRMHYAITYELFYGKPYVAGKEKDQKIFKKRQCSFRKVTLLLKMRWHCDIEASKIALMRPTRTFL